MINFLDCLKSTGLEYDYDNLLNVSFWYYPVDKTSMGEELYITMNSRGKALDSAEHLKPLLMKTNRTKTGIGVEYGITGKNSSSGY